VVGIVGHYRIGEIIGAATAGANGNRKDTPLSAGFMVSLTGMKVL
jgi:hypothetical protein